MNRFAALCDARAATPHEAAKWRERAPKRCARRSRRARGTAPGTCARSTTTARSSARRRAASAASTRSRSRGRCSRRRGVPTDARALRGAARRRRAARARSRPARAAALAAVRQHVCTIPDTSAPTLRASARTAASTRTRATWLGWAHAALGDGERAERIFRLLNPILHAETAEDSRRATASSRTSSRATSTASRRGWVAADGPGTRARRRGCGGSASKPSSASAKEEGELRIDPCIPPHWKGSRLGPHW